ncbi:diacylglycerol kinase [Thalassotalea profundi]|uniref:Diacylglycerol kinase n=1 Tax=Thalassotalea profundi TaxID=2036687 RepID=A0ABQ3IZL2_9GAMM|nr:diacylglycerol kinase [Thalassotalea profundi]GHE96473.1 diacylglycerol kinase [Thalassotalea profundi]
MREKNQYSHIQRFGPATRNSLIGLKAAYKYELAFRQEVFLTIVMTPLAAYLADNFTEFALLISGLFAILITELLNSAVEATVDRVGLEHHELSGRAKDIGSAAVFIAIVYFLIVWLAKIYTML